MSYSALYIGLTGLKAQSSALGSIGNNLANVNTYGFKSSRASFSDIFTAAGLVINEAGTSAQIGLGTSLSAVQQIFNQGALQPTETVTDLAIQGHGFFVLRNPGEADVYTRAGNFSFDAEGFLVSQSGYRVQGYSQRDADGNIIASGGVSDIQIPTGLVAPPEATSFFRAAMNLNREAPPYDAAAPNPDDSGIFSTTVTVFDSVGAEHQVTLAFTPVDTTGDAYADEWQWEARVSRADTGSVPPTGGADPDYEVINNGTFTFDADGQLIAPANITLSVSTWANGAAAQDIEWRVVDDNNDPLLTNVASVSGLDDLQKDGFALGRIRALAVDADGIMSGVFTNGQTLQLAQLAVASVNNPSGLLRLGGNVYAESRGSGPTAIGTANTGARGAVVSRALELSNVDITDQFTDLIVAERGYQANSRIITTSDQVIQEALSIKR